MIRIRDLSLPLGTPEGALAALAAKRLRVRHEEVAALEIRRRSEDARRKADIRLPYTVDAAPARRESSRR